MKIITWNCNMAFRNKAKFILKHKPDILIVPECEHPDKLKFSDKNSAPVCSLWFGDNLHKGIGIFSYGKFQLRLKKNFNPALKTIVPITVTGGNTAFTLYAIWAWNPNDPDGHYVEQIWKALHHYDKHLTNKPVILAGDFNSNTIWDRPRRVSNHSAVVKKLGEKQIYSTYHLHHKQEQGQEKHPTLYMYRHRDKPYHIDYCFASAHFAGKLKSVEVGAHKTWSKYSDHVPVIISFDEN